MNGAQDLGGMMGFGPVAPEKDEPYFHAEWEKRAMAAVIAMGATGQWTIDASRHARETLHPTEYLAKSYYDVWITALERLMAERGLATSEEIAKGAMNQPAKSVARVLKGRDVAAALAKGTSCAREIATPARFKVGDRVRTIVENPAHHTRLPRYARGKTGVIEMAHGAYVFPDTNAHGGGEQPQHVYSVAFTGPELWGRGADPDVVTSIDAWESYLEPA
ncbi:nitrile hydratase subunit beta [Terrarubrum flagellatum]|uniref:nitrile hydratase subunit beta n=1 Tax=Terrirubrum flagellatum TaxID=2895980 RepID=UPI00314530D2